MRGFSDDPLENRDGTDLPPCIDCDTPTAGQHPLSREPWCPACADEYQARMEGREPDYDAPTVAERDDAAHNAHRKGRA